jgi:hypothetical protein
MSLSKYQALLKCTLLTKLLNNSFWNKALVCMTKKTFWICNWQCFVSDIRFLLNSCQLWISLETSDLHTGIVVTHYLFSIFAHLTGKCITSIFCCFLMFMTHLLLSCHCHFPVFVSFFFAVPSKIMDRGFTA